MFFFSAMKFGCSAFFFFSFVFRFCGPASSSFGSFYLVSIAHPRSTLLYTYFVRRTFVLLSCDCRILCFCVCAQCTMVDGRRLNCVSVTSIDLSRWSPTHAICQYVVFTYSRIQYVQIGCRRYAYVCMKHIFSTGGYFSPSTLTE